MGHFYTAEGVGVFEVPKKSGDGMRPTTIKDCRERNLYPSVTTIMQVLAAPELDRWKQTQVLMAALTLPKIKDETDEAYCARIMRDAFKQVDDAASKGTSIHLAIEEHFQGRSVSPDFLPYADLADSWVKKNNITFLQHEIRLVNTELGYAGTTDGLAIKDGKYGLVDWKSRKTRPDYKIEPWAKEPMQLSAYANCPIEHEGKPVRIEWSANCFVSTTEFGRIGDAWYAKDRLDTEFEAFKHVVAIWQAQNKYVPIPR